MTPDMWTGFWLGCGAGGLLMFGVLCLVLRLVARAMANPWR
jgi:hypothetical protein